MYITRKSISYYNHRHEKHLYDKLYSQDSQVLTYNVSEIQVAKVLKGEVRSRDMIQVKQLIDIETKALKEGAQGIFFLEDYSKVKKGMPYSVINPNQGILKLLMAR